MQKLCIALLLLIAILPLCPIAANALELDSNCDLEIIVPRFLESSISQLVGVYKRETSKTVNVTYIDDTEEYITILNTEILTGGGPDVFFAGNLAFWDYAKQGALVDIGKLMENDPDIDTGDYYANILDPLRDPKGGLFAIPYSSSYIVFLVNIPLFEEFGIEIPEEWTIQLMFDKASEFTDKNDKYNDVFSFYRMYPGFVESYITDEITLAVGYNNNESYIADLPDDFFDYYNKVADISADSGTGLWGRSPGGNYRGDAEKFLFFPLQISVGNVKTHPVRDIVEFPEFEVITMPRFRSDLDVPYSLLYSLSINKNDNIEESWSFIKFLLSKEAQNNQISAIPNPIMKSAVDNRCDEIVKQTEQILESISEGADYEELLAFPRNSPNELMTAVERFISIYKQSTALLGAPIYNDANLAVTIDGIIIPNENGVYDASSIKAELLRVIDIYNQELSGDIDSGYTTIYIVLGVTAACIVICAVLIHRRRKRRKNVR